MRLFVRLCFLVSLLRVETDVANRVRWRRFKEGKFIIGALFPVTRGTHCDILQEEGLFLVEAFVYKVTELNRGALPSDELMGYDIRDTCSDPNIAVQEVLDILRRRNNVPWLNCSLRKAAINCGVVAFVGPELNNSVVSTSRILSALGIPQVNISVPLSHAISSSNQIGIFYVAFHINCSTAFVFKFEKKKI